MYNEILILVMLRQRPKHGYEIKKSIEQVLGNRVSMNNKVLYPALKHFEEIGAVQRQVIHQQGKPDRHLYQLTERGDELLQNYLREFPPALASSEAEFLTRVAFFYYLDVDERIEILEQRKAYVHGQLEHCERMLQLTDTTDNVDYARRVLAFTTQQVRNEYQWIVDWLAEMRASK